MSTSSATSSNYNLHPLFEKVEFEYFLYPIYRDVTEANVALLLRDGVPINDYDLVTRRKDSWSDGEKTESKLSAASQLHSKSDAIKGYAVIQIPTMFLWGIDWEICQEKGLSWKGFMPYLTHASSYNSNEQSCIIPTLIQGIYSAQTKEWFHNPDHSIYWRGDGLLFDKNQIEQMRLGGNATVASNAERRRNAPDAQSLKESDIRNSTFRPENDFYSGILFSKAYKNVLCRRKTLKE